MNSGDAYFLILYLVSVFQPVTRPDLLAEAMRTAKSRDDEFDSQTGVAALRKLIGRQLVIEDRGFLTCTILGNQRAAKLGLRKARDRNRLFFLKNLFRSEYNSSR